MSHGISLKQKWRPFNGPHLYLFLASWAGNDYFTPIGSYVNDTSFQLYFQRYAEPVDFISLSFRKRDGWVLYGGPKHGEIHFRMPLHSSSSDFGVELDFLASLDSATAANSRVIEHLKAVLPLVRLANTDSDAMTLDAEAALMGFAFEQYFEITGRSNADQSAAKFDDLFGVYNKTTAKDARVQRSGIDCKNKQLDWPVSKFWMWELYQYRSAIAHGGLSSSRNWGWTALEHMVMAAFVFPLVVKLDLFKERHYLLSSNDESRCCAVDTLLGHTGWADDDGSSMQSGWQKRMG